MTYSEGDRRRDKGTEQALNAVQPWAVRAWNVLLWLAQSGKEFTSEDLTALVGKPRGNRAGMNQNNAIGSILRRASTSGIIVLVGLVKASDPKSHSRTLKVWKGTLVGASA